MHLVVGTPMYGGMCCSEYVQSILALKEAMMQHDLKVTFIFLGNESLIQRARNSIAHHFLSIPDATHLLFMDADQSFRANDVAKMIKADKDIITGIVPMKGINWDRVRQGAVLGHDNLSRLTGIFNINKLDGHEMIDKDTPFEIKHGGSGMMLIKKEVFEKMKDTVGYYMNGGASIPPEAKVYDFFQVRNINGELLSEDYNFCHDWRELGGKIWAAPWCEVGHFGSYHFNGVYFDHAV